MTKYIESIGIGAGLALGLIATLAVLLDPGCCPLIGHFTHCAYGTMTSGFLLLAAPAAVTLTVAIIADNF